MVITIPLPNCPSSGRKNNNNNKRTFSSSSLMGHSCFAVESPQAVRILLSLVSHEWRQYCQILQPSGQQSPQFTYQSHSVWFWILQGLVWGVTCYCLLIPSLVIVSCYELLHNGRWGISLPTGHPGQKTDGKWMGMGQWWCLAGLLGAEDAKEPKSTAPGWDRVKQGRGGGSPRMMWLHYVLDVL